MALIHYSLGDTLRKRCIQNETLSRRVDPERGEFDKPLVTDEEYGHLIAQLHQSSAETRSLRFQARSANRFRSDSKQNPERVRGPGCRVFRECGVGGPIEFIPGPGIRPEHLG